MFDKILIANRGEIACRVISTARKMGVATVAAYSDADAQALHVELADETVRIGPAPVAESYLRGEAIIQAALETGAQAIHPGYGFLSENADFVEAVTAAGLTFIGPTASAIRAMGLKDAAKELMEASGVPVVPGYLGASQDTGIMAREAEKIGYPVLIKSRAGGGGKGMRLVEDPRDFADALSAAQREGEASFGDPTCLIEKYITSPRHIEIQVFGDAHGNVVHLFERDCSLQRRHQKVIEEAPAPDMPSDVRAAMGDAALKAARAIGYQGAGTIEFIADGSGPLRADGFWFMEMNTRLQVEHPVTEAITGLDLVEMQLRVASGEPLPVTQEDVTMVGHAFEARIYAEDPSTGFLPAIGKITHLDLPDVARIDSGVRAGDMISPHYDPMIAKLIVHGEDRRDALAKLAQCLERCRIAGLVTNTGFLQALATQPDFVAGRVDTGLIGTHLDTLVGHGDVPASVKALALIYASGLFEASDTPFSPWSKLTGWRSWGPAEQVLSVVYAGDVITGTVLFSEQGWRLDGHDLSITQHSTGDIRVKLDGLPETLGIYAETGSFTIFRRGQAFAFSYPDPSAGRRDETAAGNSVAAPMPGSVTQVNVAVGDTVQKGQALLTLEAMKMEHVLVAPFEGEIAEVLTEQGAQVAHGAVLVVLEAQSDG